MYKWNSINSCINPYINLAVVCLLACLLVRPSRLVTFFNGSWLFQIKSKLHQTFSICKVWSPKLFKIVWASPRACVHAQRVKSCTLFFPIFLVIFLTFWISSAAILKQSSVEDWLWEGFWLNTQIGSGLINLLGVNF